MEGITVKKIDYIGQFETWEKGFEFYNSVKVRFSETDMFGHLNNTVPFTYFEEARIAYFSHLGMMKDWLDDDFETIIVVADLQCDFLQQVFFNEKLKVYVKANSVGNSSVDIHYMVKKEDNTVCFVGRGTIVQISKITGKGVPWKEEIKSAFLETNTSVSS